MIIGISYCSPVVLNYAIERKKIRSSIISQEENFKQCVEECKTFLQSGDNKMPVLFIGGITTAKLLAQNIEDHDIKFKAVIFDTPAKLNYAGITILDATFVENSIWEWNHRTPEEINTILRRNDNYITMTELSTLKEKRFKLKETGVDSEKESKEEKSQVTEEEPKVEKPDATTIKEEEEEPKVEKLKVTEEELKVEKPDMTTRKEEKKPRRGRKPKPKKEDQNDTIDRCRGDLLEDKYNDGLKSIMVAEDKALIAATGRNSVKNTQLDSSIPEGTPVKLTESSDNLPSVEPVIAEKPKRGRKPRKFESIVSRLDNEVKVKFCAFVGGISEYNVEKDYLSEDLLEYGTSTEAHDLWTAFYAFIKNDIDLGEAAKFGGCTEKALEVLADNIDLNDITFAEIPRKIYKPSPSTVLKAMPIKKSEAVLLVDTIDHAFININSDSILQNLKKATAGYVTGAHSTEGTFNKTITKSRQSGADAASITSIIKMVTGKYGQRLFYAYGDMVIYGTTVEEAAKLSNIDPTDIHFLVEHSPINKKVRYREPLWERLMPEYITKIRGIPERRKTTRWMYIIIDDKRKSFAEIK